MTKHLLNKKYLLLILFSMLILQSIGQCPTVKRKVPFMWVSTTESDNRKDWFKNGKMTAGSVTKQQVLDLAINNGHPHPNFYSYSVTDFDAMLKMMTDDAQAQGKLVIGLRIYFGAHDSQHEPDGGFIDHNTPDKQVILIYAPTDAAAKDIGNYYFFAPNGKPRPFKKTGSYPDGANLNRSWLGLYRTSIGGAGLVNTLEAGAKENVDNINNGKISDTKSLLYCFADFLDFIQVERAYQDNLRKPLAQIDEIEIDLAAYTNAGVLSGTEKSKFKGRLHILFEFKSRGNIVNIDSSTDFSCRMENAGKADTNCNFSPFIISKHRDAGDNGQLCPPYNCPIE